MTRELLGRIILFLLIVGTIAVAYYTRVRTPKTVLQRVDPLSSLDDSSNNQIFQNEQFGFEFRFPLSYRVDQAVPTPSNPLLARRFVVGATNSLNLTYPGASTTYFVDIWKPAASTTTMLSLYFPGLKPYSTQTVYIDHYAALEYSFQGLNVNEATTTSTEQGLVYRVYLVTPPNFNFILGSTFCNNQKQPACDDFLNNFKFIIEAVPPPNLPSTITTDRYVSWEEALTFLQSGQVTSAEERSTHEVILQLFDLTIIHATEAKLGDIMNAIKNCGSTCATILIIPTQ